MPRTSPARSRNTAAAAPDEADETAFKALAAPISIAAAKSARRGPTALRSAPRVRRAPGETSDAPKRAAVMLRRGMRQSEFNQVEALFDAHDIGWLPILAEPNRRPTSTAYEFCGLVVTGGDMTPTDKEAKAITAAVQDALKQRAPVLALSDAVPLVLEAAGLDAPAGDQYAVLIQGGVEFLEDARAIESAIDRMAASPAAREAAH